MMSNPMILSFRPAERTKAWLFDFLVIVTGSILLSLSARFSFPVPFSPVPITLQTLVVLYLGLTLGKERAFASIMAYIGQGVIGFPVFAGGKAGFAVLAGPTGGYILGFAFAAYITGLAAERGMDRKIITNFLAMLVGNIIIYAFGAFWLSLFLGANKALTLGVLPFIPGDLVKIFVAVSLLPLGRRFIK
jgi:biotin transport system substrate-specific component